MGVRWRRFNERVRAATHTGGSLAPTPNVRNETMLREAGDFLALLKRMEKAIRTMKSADEAALSTTKAVMTSPLPVVYEDTAASAGAAVPAHAPIGGSGFNADVVSRASLELGRRLESEVLAPVARWQDVYHSLVSRLADLEKQRLEVDSRRRTVAGLSAKVDSQRARLSSGASGTRGSAKAESKLESTIKLLQHKEGKLSVSTQTFQEQEALLHRDLTTLIKDTAWLRNYVSAALAISGGALTEAAGAFGAMPDVVPSSKMAALPVTPTTTPKAPATPAAVATPPVVEVQKVAVPNEAATNPFAHTV